MNSGNGGNGINVAMDVLRLGPNLPKLFETALNRRTLFQVVLLSSDRQVPWMNIIQVLKP